MALFEDFEGRIPQVNKALKEYGFKEGEAGLNEARELCKARGFDPYDICQSTQQICFEDAKWAYVLGSAIAIKEAEKSGDKTGSTAAANIGKGLQAFCLPGSVADDRKVGLGHGNLGARLLSEETQCFAFLAGHESFAAAEGAIKIAANANKVRKNKLRVILNGLGRTPPRSSAASTALLTFRLNLTTLTDREPTRLSKSLRKFPTEATPTASSLSATAPTTFARAWPSCGTRTLTFQSQETPPTRLVSSTPLPEHTRKSACSPERSTSQ